MNRILPLLTILLSTQYYWIYANLHTGNIFIKISIFRFLSVNLDNGKTGRRLLLLLTKKTIATMMVMVVVIISLLESY